MSIRVEAYTPGGIASGVLTRAGSLHDALGGGPTLVLEGVSWRPTGASDPQPIGEVSIPIDDVLVATTDDEVPINVHSAWHSIDLDVGPYRVDGEMPTLPGFDPGRALTRPSGDFVMLRDVRLAMVADPTVPLASGRFAQINRYGVERVAADLMLGFFFPGAVMEMEETDEAASTDG